MSLLKTFGIGAAALLCLSLARLDTASAADPADQATTSSAAPEAGAHPWFVTSQGTGGSQAPASSQTPAPQPESLMDDGGGGICSGPIPIWGGEICCVTIIFDYCWYEP
jgi:hypothetical protein